MVDLCEQKNSSDKPCPNLESEDAGNQKQEHPNRRAKPLTQDGQKFSVYALVENGVIRYVGLTSQTLVRRLCQHFQDMNRPYRKEHKTNWLRACKRDGITVTIKSLRSRLSLSQAQQIERQIINRLRTQLVNVHEGGSSGYAGLPDDAKERHSASGKARYLCPKQKEKAKAASKIMHAAKAAKRMAGPLPEESRVSVGAILHTIRVESHLDGYGFEIKIRQAARRNQVVAETFGRQSKPHGLDFLLAHLRKRLVTRWSHAE